MDGLPYASVVIILVVICFSMVAALGMLYALSLVQNQYKHSLMWRQLRHLTFANLLFGFAVMCYRGLSLRATITKPMLTGLSKGDRDLMCRVITGVMDAANTTMFMTEAHLGLAFAVSIYQCPVAMSQLRWNLGFVWPLGIIGSLLVQCTSEIAWLDEGCRVRFPNEDNAPHVYSAIYSFAIAICSISYLMSYAKMRGSNRAVRSKVRHRARGFLFGWLVCESLNYIRMLDGYGQMWPQMLSCSAIALKCLSPVANALVYAREGGFLARIVSRKRTRFTLTPRSFNVSLGGATIVEYPASPRTPKLPERNMLACFDPEPEPEHEGESVQLEPGA